MAISPVATTHVDPDQTLNDRQQLFVDHYVIAFNPEESAIKAGYSDVSAYAIGRENIRKPHIQKAIGIALKARTVRLGIDQDYVVHEIVRLYHVSLAAEDRTNARHCLEMLAKHVQLYNDSLININVYESMSDADLQAQIEGTQRALIDQKP